MADRAILVKRSVYYEQKMGACSTYRSRARFSQVGGDVAIEIRGLVHCRALVDALALVLLLASRLPRLGVQALDSNKVALMDAEADELVSVLWCPLRDAI